MVNENTQTKRAFPSWNAKLRKPPEASVPAKPAAPAPAAPAAPVGAAESAARTPWGTGAVDPVARAAGEKTFRGIRNAEEVAAAAPVASVPPPPAQRSAAVPPTVPKTPFWEKQFSTIAELTGFTGAPKNVAQPWVAPMYTPDQAAAAGYVAEVSVPADTSGSIAPGAAPLVMGNEGDAKRLTEGRAYPQSGPAATVPPSAGSNSEFAPVNAADKYPGTTTAGYMPNPALDKIIAERNAPAVASVPSADKGRYTPEEIKERQGVLAAIKNAGGPQYGFYDEMNLPALAKYVDPATGKMSKEGIEAAREEYLIGRENKPEAVAEERAAFMRPYELDAARAAGDHPNAGSGREGSRKTSDEILQAGAAAWNSKMAGEAKSLSDLRTRRDKLTDDASTEARAIAKSTREKEGTIEINKELQKGRDAMQDKELGFSRETRDANIKAAKDANVLNHENALLLQERGLGSAWDIAYMNNTWNAEMKAADRAAALTGITKQVEGSLAAAKVAAEGKGDTPYDIAQRYSTDLGNYMKSMTEARGVRGWASYNPEGKPIENSELANKTAATTEYENIYNNRLEAAHYDATNKKYPTALSIRKDIINGRPMLMIQNKDLTWAFEPIPSTTGAPLAVKK